MWIIRIARDALAWIGLVAIAGVGLAFLVGPTWCLGENCSVQGWLSALSGWAGSIAAASTIGLLWSQSRDSARSAEIAQRSFEHTQETTRTQLRAYVFLEESNFIEADGKIIIQFKNMGSSPARAVKYTVKITFRNDQKNTDNVVLDVSRDAPPIGQGDIFRYTVSAGRGYNQALISAMQGNFARFIIEGELNYHDVFGEKHFTKYRCFTVEDGGKIIKAMNSADQGNFAD
ncbi:MAG: hypothetical protein E5Y74_00615 [Mesorhizobium sp.]|nr:MAG: hypothetical protein E5Y74_00615 [Mesorhizobium sp.]